MTDDKFLLLKMHGFSEGLSDDVVREIADQCELVKCDSGEYLHHANQPFDSVYMVIHGRIRQSLIDIQGNVMLQRYQTSGGQTRRIGRGVGRAVTDRFGRRRTDDIAAAGLSKRPGVDQEIRRIPTEFLATRLPTRCGTMLMKDRRQKKPTLVSIFHQSPVTRPLTRRLVTRLKELGENPYVLNDQTDWQPMDDVPYFCLIQNGRYVTEQEFRNQVNLWSNVKRAFIDVDAAVDLQRATNITEASDKVLWCVTPENWQQSVDRLRAIVARAPGWRDKINIVWLLPGDTRWAPLAPELNRACQTKF